MENVDQFPAMPAVRAAANRGDMTGAMDAVNAATLRGAPDCLIALSYLWAKMAAA